MATATETKGTAWLAEHVNSTTGSSLDGFGIRVLLRKLNKDGVIDRGEGRYTFSGPKDPTVVAVVKAVKSGDHDKAKTEKIDELKAKRAAKKKAAADPEPEAEDEADEEAPKPARKRSAKKAAAPAAKRSSRRKPKPAVEEPADDEGDDIDEL